jgi:hypothetical protein
MMTWQTYLFESMVNDGLKICVGYLWKHLTNCPTGLLLRVLLCSGAPMEQLTRGIVLDTSSDPIGPPARFVFAKAMCFIVDIAKLVTSQVDYLEGEVVADSVDVVRKFGGIGVHLVLGFRLWTR